MKPDDGNDDQAAMPIDPEPPGVTLRTFSHAEAESLDTPEPEWGVEYRFAGEDDSRTHLHIPEPPTHEAAKAHAEKLTVEGAYDLVAVVRLPYDTK